jgi:hypothetical protein
MDVFQRGDYGPCLGAGEGLNNEIKIAGAILA